MKEKAMELYQEMMADAEIQRETKKELEALKAAGQLEDFFAFIASQEEEEGSGERDQETREVFEGLRAFFKGQGWKFIADENEQVFVLGFRMRHATIKTYVKVDADNQTIRINTILPVTCRPEYRLILANELMKKNLHLRYGCFHLDHEDGEITFRFSYSYADEGFNKGTFDHYLNVCTMGPDMDFAFINKIASGQLDEEEAESYLDTIKEMISAMKSQGGGQG